MRMISNTELTSRTDSELAILFSMVSKQLAVAKAGTPERRKVIASLQNISIAQRQRHQKLAAPGR